MLWTAYKTALDDSEVAEGDLTEEQTKKLEKFRGLLWAKKEKKNILTDEVEGYEVVVTPVQAAWNEKKAAFDNAVKEYNNKRISAMNSDNALVVQDWALNGDLYRSQVRTANDAWVSGGYKNEVDQMNAYIDQVTRRSLRLMKAALIGQFDAGLEKDIVSGQPYYRTLPIPSGFATGAGWTQFTFKEDNKDTYARSETNA